MSRENLKTGEKGENSRPAFNAKAKKFRQSEGAREEGKRRRGMVLLFPLNAKPRAEEKKDGYKS